MQKKGFPESYDLPTLLALSQRHQGRPASGARAGLFAFDLRHRAEPMDRDRPAGHPDRRGRQRSADRPAAARRQGRCPWFRTSSTSPSISMPTSRCCAIGIVRRFLTLRDTAFHDPRSYFHRYAPLSGRGSHRDRIGDLGTHQPRQSRGKYPADPAACDADPEKGRAITWLRQSALRRHFRAG